MGVRNHINDLGNSTANQFVITTKNSTYFQSYDSIVCRISHKLKVRAVLSSNWDYSNTTRKYLYQFLRNHGIYVHSRKDVLNLIKNKEIVEQPVSSLNIAA